MKIIFTPFHKYHRYPFHLSSWRCTLFLMYDGHGSFKCDSIRNWCWCCISGWLFRYNSYDREARYCLSGRYIVFYFTFLIGVGNSFLMIVTPVMHVIKLGKSGRRSFSMNFLHICLGSFRLYFLVAPDELDGDFFLMFLRTDAERCMLESLIVCSSAAEATMLRWLSNCCPQVLQNTLIL